MLCGRDLMICGGGTNAAKTARGDIPANDARDVMPQMANQRLARSISSRTVSSP